MRKSLISETNMRFLKLGVYYSAYLDGFYRKRSDLGTKPYVVQHKTIIDDCFGSSDFWTREFSKLGYESIDLIANAEFLQKRWAIENDLKFDQDNWLFEITAAQIKKFRPEVILVADYSTFTADFLRNIRSECPSISLILGWCGAPYGDVSVFSEWDIALSCVPELVTDFQSKGIQSFHINHAFAPSVLDKLDLTKPPFLDFIFTGSIVKQKQFHLEREKLLTTLVKNTDLQIRANVASLPVTKQRKFDVAQKTRRLIAATRRAGISEKWLSKFSLTRDLNSTSVPEAQYVDDSIARRTEPSVFGIEMFQLLRDSRVVLNNHIDISKTSASNMRLFEATGVGTCLLTDWKKNLTELFQPDDEVLTYCSPEECVEKVKFILDHEDIRREIAAKGQRRVLRDHTFGNRARQVDEIIKAFLARQ